MSKTKYPCVYKDKNGKFFYQVELGIDNITGKRIQKKGRKDNNGKNFSTAKSCYDYSIYLKRKYVESQGIFANGIKLDDFIEKYFIGHYKAKVQDSTFRTKIHIIRKVQKYFANVKIEDINVRKCEAFKSDLINNGDYSKTYASMIYGCFRQILDYAVNLEFVHENVSKKTKSIPKEKIYVPFWTLDEFQKVISTFCLDDLYEHMGFVMLWLYFNTGIRVGEGQALTWNKVNFKDKTLTINSTIDLSSPSSYTIKNRTKTDSGNRIISLDDSTINILKRWKSTQKKYGVSKFIISYCDKPIRRNTIHRIINRHAKLANVKRIQAKGLRHSHVSYLINHFNADILTVSNRLGHSGPEITLKHYSHLWPNRDRSLAKKMSGIIKFDNPKKSMVEFNGNQFIKYNSSDSCQNPAKS
uniref:tyrosine-type recombinase/integrase n=1 Tax=Anaerococcus mediterraneensis TaxID=1870984 RepID=UPI0009320324|nr:site-specific integrase [Anaerococcus mediterraneensis]